MNDLKSQKADGQKKAAGERSSWYRQAVFGQVAAALVVLVLMGLWFWGCYKEKPASFLEKSAQMEVVPSAEEMEMLQIPKE